MAIKFRKFHTQSHCILWKLRNFTATVFSQIFRQINVLLKNFTVNQFDEKNLRGSKFLSVVEVTEIYAMRQKFRESKVL